MNQIKPDDRTEISPRGGTKILHPNQTKIDPLQLTPANRNRFKLNEPLVAKIEKIARARVNVAKYIGVVESENNIELWKDNNHQTALAMSVNASSEIEGEEVTAELIPLILNEATQPDSGEAINQELAHRLDVIRNIYKTYIWALTSSLEKEMISPNFILEVHKRMFSNSSHYRSFAGEWKTKEIVIKGSRYYVETLSSSRVEEAINLLCERTNRDFSRNKSTTDKPLLTIIAEFILDFLAIHPFQDGNGRTARLLSTYLLERVGYHFSSIYPIDSIINERRSEYFEALFSGQRNWYSEQEDITEWVNFYVDAIFTQWERAHSEIKRSKAKKLLLS